MSETLAFGNGSRKVELKSILRGFDRLKLELYCTVSISGVLQDDAR